MEKATIEKEKKKGFTERKGKGKEREGEEGGGGRRVLSGS